MTTPPDDAPPAARLLADQRQRWGRNDCVRVEAYLGRYPALRHDDERVLDLIYGEVFLREQRGERPRREDYLRRFPHLSAQLAAQFDVHEALEAGAVGEAGPGEVPGHELLGMIGQGAMGRVYKARSAARGGLVAVKLLNAEQQRHRDVRRRFLAEARAAALLRHPNIVEVFEVGECAAGPYFVMELIDGPSLEEVIRQGVPEIKQAAGWLAVVAEAVHHAHQQGVIHRDLKPANVMLDAAGVPRVMDFGMAKIVRPASGQSSSTQQGAIVGTPAYMPPEQAGTGEIKAGPYSDVFSLGAILYALLTGRPPFDGGGLVRTVMKLRSDDPPPPVRSLRPDAPEALERICNRCLKKQPADRYGSAWEVAAALRAFTRAAEARPAWPVALCAGATGETIGLRQPTTVIGRAPECDVVLPTPDVSRRHCRVVRSAGEVVVEDLGSSRGTRVNGVAVARARLRHGDRLEIADQVFEVLLGPAGGEG
jgi:tRNA A-37 threonylcarbamoyl transferase component Bud32